MKNSLLINILCSLPVIILTLYFIPFLGVCLILFRLFVSKKSNISTCISLVIIGLLVFIPKLINILFKSSNNNIISKINEFVTNDVYKSIMRFGKLSITVGIIFLILSIIFQNIFNKGLNMFKNYVQKEEQRSYQIEKENNLIMQEKREKAKNTRNVVCKHCGADNLISDTVGKCKYCRRPLQ